MRLLAMLALAALAGCVQQCQGCDDGNVCTQDGCSGGQCTHAPLTGEAGGCRCDAGTCIISAQGGSTDGDYAERQYVWQYGGQQYSYNVSLSREWYGYYRSKSRERSYDIFVSDSHSRSALAGLAQGLEAYAAERNFTENERLDFAVSFVRGMRYTPDNVTTPYDNYPRYAFETLYEDGGDCEDTSILMAGLLQEMGYGTVLVLLPDPPGHMAVGVACDSRAFGYPVAPLLHEGTEYCYLETTGAEYRIGEIPEEFRNGSYTMMPLAPRAELDIAFNATYAYTSKKAAVGVDINVTNVGSADAKNVGLALSLVGDNGATLAAYSFNRTGVPADSEKVFSVRGLELPAGAGFTIVVAVAGDNFDSKEVRSRRIAAD